MADYRPTYRQIEEMEVEKEKYFIGEMAELVQHWELGHLYHMKLVCGSVLSNPDTFHYTAVMAAEDGIGAIDDEIKRRECK